MTARIAQQACLGPVTGLALLLALLLGGRLVGADDLAIYVAGPSRGPLAWWFRRSGFAGVTLGAVVLLASSRLLGDTGIVGHEREHVRQWLRWSVLFIAAYPLASLWARAQGGSWYRDNCFERAARDAAARRT